MWCYMLSFILHQYLFAFSTPPSMTKRLLKVFLHFKDDSEPNSHSKCESTPLFPAFTSRVQKLFISLHLIAQRQRSEMSVGDLLVIPIQLIQSGLTNQIFIYGVKGSTRNCFFNFVAMEIHELLPLNQQTSYCNHFSCTWNLLIFNTSDLPRPVPFLSSPT